MANGVPFARIYVEVFTRVYVPPEVFVHTTPDPVRSGRVRDVALDMYKKAPPDASGAGTLLRFLCNIDLFAPLFVAHPFCAFDFENLGGYGLAENERVAHVNMLSTHGLHNEGVVVVEAPDKDIVDANGVRIHKMPKRQERVVSSVGAAANAEVARVYLYLPRATRARDYVCYVHFTTDPERSQIVASTFCAFFYTTLRASIDGTKTWRVFDFLYGLRHRPTAGLPNSRYATDAVFAPYYERLGGAHVQPNERWLELPRGTYDAPNEGLYIVAD